MVADKGPTLVAVWPGMGQVALTAGFYLMSKLHMHETEPLPVQDLFDVDQIDIQEGIVHTAQLPRARIFRSKGAAQRPDLIVLIGEAQPPLGKLAFCRRLLEYADRAGVREIYTFAALVDDIPLGAPSRVFGVATHAEDRDRLRRAVGVNLLASGSIAGLNGLLLGEASQRGMHGTGLLGELPALAAPVPFAKASSAVLEVFCRLSGVRLELGELEEYGRSIENQLAEAVDRLKEAAREQLEPAEEVEPEPGEEDRRRVEALFAQAERDRSKTFELKRELDRLGFFVRYENRFLDLFRKPPEPGPGG